ncbi:MAG TPA: tripartite tricarboxylate transporter substrate binding protein [Burkholderiaceae bacterium]|jgi:tripartite-type tricarboxylate transporter receptor subunit TctC|nr:tripartite tricarboxylate transporter substrate binding protein [Burkholderiaceae bacterium]
MSRLSKPSAPAGANLRSSRRRTSAALLAFAASAVGLSGSALAQTAAPFPSKPLTLMVPFPPGAATDAVARALAVPLAKHLGQQVVVENRPGAAGTMATSIVAQSAATDGHTVAIAPATIFRVPHLQKVPYDTLKDLTFIMNFSGYTFSLVVAESTGIKTVPEFVAYAKANPGKISIGASGAGSTGHIATHMLAQKTGTDLTFVPFKGGAEVLSAFVGGHISAVIDGGWAQIEKQGKGRVLMTFQEQRIPRLPNVPTAREAGYDIVSISPIGLVGPKNMDPRAVKVWHDAMKAALSDPMYRKLLELHDLEDAYMSGDDYRKLAQKLWVDEKKNFDMIGMKPQ